MEPMGSTAPQQVARIPTAAVVGEAPKRLSRAGVRRRSALGRV